MPSQDERTFKRSQDERTLKMHLHMIAYVIKVSLHKGDLARIDKRNMACFWEDSGIRLIRI